MMTHYYLLYFHRFTAPNSIVSLSMFFGKSIDYLTLPPPNNILCDLFFIKKYL